MGTKEPFASCGFFVDRLTWQKDLKIGHRPSSSLIDSQSAHQYGSCVPNLLMFLLVISFIFNVFQKGEDNMNAAGLIFALSGVSGVLAMPHFQTLPATGTITQGELDGTRKGIAAAIASLKKTRAEKIEAMVAQYNDELTTYHDKFNSSWGADPIGGFRAAQIMEGYVTSILNKSGIRG
jgi:hypothetical protein